MLSKLQTIIDRYDELNLLLSDPHVLQDQDRYRRLIQEHASLQPMVDAFHEFRRLTDEAVEHRELLRSADDHEFRELVREELVQIEDQLEKKEAQLRELIMPRDPNDERNVIMEIRAGAGGEEAALFVAVLYRMYTQYAEAQGWRTELVDMNETEIGGFREIIFMIEGRGAFSRFKYESGVHRVQRVPVTESGRMIVWWWVSVGVLRFG